MQLKIEKLVYGGEGLAHDGKSTIFVPFVLPEEEIEAEITERRKKLVRARIAGLLKAAPERIEAACPHFSACGGCDYQHISHDPQLRFKEQILRETLRRIGHIEWKGPITIHRSPPWAYRNRAQWTIRPNKEGASTENKSVTSMGYLRARSSELCPVDTCLIISPRLLATFQALREAFGAGSLPDTIREIEAFADSGDNEILLTASFSSFPRKPEALLEQLQQLIPWARSVLLQDTAGNRMALLGPGFLEYEVLQRKLRAGHLSFFQVNRFLIEELVKTVCELAGRGRLALDLYAGVGLFAGFLSERFAETVAVEADPASGRDLESLAAGRHSIGVVNKPAGLFLADWSRKRTQGTADTIVVDPPRAGLEGEVVQHLMALGSHSLVYVSCDPSTLARDLAKLCSSAYTVRELHLFDMFPQTYHIESVAFLERTR